MKTVIEIMALIGFAIIAFGIGFSLGYWFCRKSIIKITDDKAEQLINWINSMPV